MDNATNDEITDLNGLTAQERALIEAFRKLSEKAREAFLKQAQSGKAASAHFHAGRARGS